MEQLDQFVKEALDVVAPDDYKEERAVEHPYERLEKAAVLQDARIFHDSILVRENPRKCCVILSQILYLQNGPKSASKLSHEEATELFFAATKLFVDAEDASLRRLVYLFIKEMRPLCDPSDVIIVTSCLTKDMTCDVGLYRANAIRALVDIIDSAMLGSIERYIKQAIVDEDRQVSNAAIVSASHLFGQSQDNATIVRRWVNEVQEMLVKQTGRGRVSNEDMVQANALRLLCQMKGHDRLGMAKVLQKFSAIAGSGIRSPMAIVILIRLCGKLLHDEMSTAHASVAEMKNMSPLCKIGFDFLDGSLGHRDPMIAYEAAKTYCLLPVETHNLSRAMECFRQMLLSDRPAERFAAVRTLSKVAEHPRAVALCNEGLEHCVDDSNSQIATLAVGVLLKTGTETTVDRMLGKIATLITEMPDEFKIKMLDSLEGLCLKYPAKHRSIVAFLAGVLREEGGFEFKLGVVNTVVSLMGQMPETTEGSLLHLCETIEDCEYTYVVVRCLHVIAELGPKTTVPSRYVRFIYNRIILENSTVRSAAVSALADFAAHCPSLRTSILGLLKNTLSDEDDETRDRASMAVSLLTMAIEQHPYVAPTGDEVYDEISPDTPTDDDVAAFVYLQKLPMSFGNLEASIKAYTSIPGAIKSDEQLALSALPVVEDSSEASEPATDEDGMANGLDGQPAAKPVEAKDPASAVYAIPELADLGRVFRSSHPIALTEEETEYVVRCIKHVMPEHIVLQFIILNTVEDMQLQNMVVDLECDSDAYEIIGDVPADKVSYGERVSAFAVLQRSATGVESARFACQLNFRAVQLGPDGEPLGEGFAEEYPLEALTLAPADYMAKVAVADFRQAWNGSDAAGEALGKFALQYKNLADAVSAVIDLLGMAACDGTGQSSTITEDKKQHMIHLSGRFLCGHEVLARAQLAIKPGEGTLLKIAIRSDDKSVSETVMSCVA
ncbi:hypothetical protein ACHAXT_002210 [Thalassiosira profunda]